MGSFCSLLYPQLYSQWNWVKRSIPPATLRQNVRNKPVIGCWNKGSGSGSGSGSCNSITCNAPGKCFTVLNQCNLELNGYANISPSAKLILANFSHETMQSTGLCKCELAKWPHLAVQAINVLSKSELKVSVLLSHTGYTSNHACFSLLLLTQLKMS